MNAELCRRLGRALGTHPVSPRERSTVAQASMAAESWDDLPAVVQILVAAIERRPASPSTPT